MKYEIKPTNKFQKDLKRAQKRGRPIEKLTEIIKLLADGKELPPRNRDHALVGDCSGLRECHIEPDWLLVYKIEQETLILFLVRTGSHADLFC